MHTRNLRFTWRFALVLLALGTGFTFAGGLHLATHAAAPHVPVVAARSSRAPNLPSQLGDVFAG